KNDDIPAELRYEHDPDKAKALLAKAGFGNGLTIKWTVPDRTYDGTAQAIQDQVRSAGITIDIQSMDWNQWLAFGRQNPNLYIWGGLAPTTDNELRAYFHSSAMLGKPTAVRTWSHYRDIGGAVDQIVDEPRGTGGAG